MRRFCAYVLVTVAAALWAAPALAKETHVELGASVPADLGPGETWSTTVTVVPEPPAILYGSDPASITVRNVKTGATREYQGVRMDKPGIYRIDVVFPTAGVWAYEVHDGLTPRAFQFPPVTIRGDAPAPAAAPAPREPASDGAPVLWIVLGALGVLLTTAAAAAAVRRSRLEPRASA